MRRTTFMWSLKNNEPKFYAGPWRRCWDIATGALSDVLDPTISYVSPFCIVMPSQGEGKVTFAEAQISREIAIKFCMDSPAVRMKTNYLCVRKTDDLQWGCTNVRICISKCSSPRKLFAFINVCASRDLWTRHSQRKILDYSCGIQ